MSQIESLSQSESRLSQIESRQGRWGENQNSLPTSRTPRTWKIELQLVQHYRAGLQEFHVKRLGGVGASISTGDAGDRMTDQSLACLDVRGRAALKLSNERVAQALEAELRPFEPNLLEVIRELLANRV